MQQLWTDVYMLHEALHAWHLLVKFTAVMQMTRTVRRKICTGGQAVVTVSEHPSTWRPPLYRYQQVEIILFFYELDGVDGVAIEHCHWFE